MGVGKRYSNESLKDLKSGMSLKLAEALPKAIEMPKIALAPSLRLFLVPSSSIKKQSNSDCVEKVFPMILSANIVFTFLTAFKTPLPKNLLGSPSLNSTASCSPVEAPEGTIALPFQIILC